MGDLAQTGTVVNVNCGDSPDDLSTAEGLERAWLKLLYSEPFDMERLWEVSDAAKALRSEEK